MPSSTVDPKDLALVADRDMVDITGPKIVEIDAREDGRVVWINVNGKCLLRCCNINRLKITNRAKTKKKRR